MDDWLVYHWPDVRVPRQGWKIHASACLDNAEEILATVWDYCVPRRISFKFIRSLQLLFIRNRKYAAPPVERSRNFLVWRSHNLRERVCRPRVPRGLNRCSKSG